MENKTPFNIKRFEKFIKKTNIITYSDIEEEEAKSCKAYNDNFKVNKMINNKSKKNHLFKRCLFFISFMNK